MNSYPIRELTVKEADEIKEIGIKNMESKRLLKAYCERKRINEKQAVRVVHASDASTLINVMKGSLC